MTVKKSSVTHTDDFKMDNQNGRNNAPIVYHFNAVIKDSGQRFST